MTVTMNPPVPSTPERLLVQLPYVRIPAGSLTVFHLLPMPPPTTGRFHLAGRLLQVRVPLPLPLHPAMQGIMVMFQLAGNVCGSSAAQNRAVTVNPRPTVAALPLTQTICSATAISAINITNPNSVSGTTFTWSRDNTGNLTGMPNSGSGGQRSMAH